MDHSVPLGLLLIELTFNAVRIAQRHFGYISAIAFCYLILNFTVTKITGEPPYPILSWDSTIGYLLPLGLIVGAFILMYLYYFINNFKLASTGYEDIVKVL